MFYTEKGIKRYRWKELGLLIIPSLLLLLAMTQLLLAKIDAHSTLSTANMPTIHDLIPILGMIGTLFAANVVMSLFFRKADQMLLPIAGLLSGLGVIMATRLGPDLADPRIRDPLLGSKQLLWVLIGIALCLSTVFVLRSTRWLARYKYTWIVLGFLSLTYSFYLGIKSFSTGAPTHDTLPFINVQPSEFLKICIVIFFAGYLSENRDILSQGYLRLGFLRLPPLRQLGPLVVMLGLGLVIFLVVRELGLALLVYGLFLCMTYLGSGKIGYVIFNLCVFVFLAFIGYSLLGYIRARFAIVGIDVVNWTPTSDAQYQKIVGAGQIVQGLIALASGGIFGSGLGLGATPLFVPVAHEDMILTSLGEELGLAGLFAILALYLFIVYRGFRIAIESSNPFNQLMAAGLTSVFAIQTLIICAGNLKLMPLTGIPLPFISHGGSSVLANYIIIGILLRISYINALEREGML